MIHTFSGGYSRAAGVQETSRCTCHVQFPPLGDYSQFTSYLYLQHVSPYANLRTLNDAFEPIAARQDKDVIAWLRQLQKAQWCEKIKAWLHKCELTYHDTVTISIPNVIRTQAQEAFVDATPDVHCSPYNFGKVQAKLNKA
jgi:hypothetical protein